MKIIKGRINRRTYLAGSAMTVFVTLVLVFFFLAPFALIELAFNGLAENKLFNLIQYLFLAIPAIFFFLAMLSLISKRAQDFGGQGIGWFMTLVLLFGVNHYARHQILSLAMLLVVGILVFRPGSAKRNKYGGRPPQKVRLQDITRV